MPKNKNYLTHGPGGTFWYVHDDGGISVCKHNDTGWCSTFTWANEELTAEFVCRKLDVAYQAGIEDGKEQIRRALGVEPWPGPSLQTNTSEKE